MRVFPRLATASAAAAAALLALAVPASAHVRVTADNTARGGYATLEFSVPNESQSKALTTELTVQLPDVGSASTELLPGWTSSVDRDAAKGTVRAVTWKAVPGNGIGPDQFALFRVRVKLPETESVAFPATQTYADGQVVRWDQQAQPGGAEPEHPAPTLDLTQSKADHDGHSAHAPQVSVTHDSAQNAGRPDKTARWFGGIGLILGAVALVLAVTNRRRQQ
ncbi:YcnI family copper-binding membrane protein [Mycobacteroides chelonae]|uniref:YcnI family copper-binding membrane protein n=1 Tax=Mycobacteroides chelonae TaxID=1774 RepID=UPI001C2BC81C|nr:YcnI family protein [Mycobacteroides chelonae]MBV0918355.1 YcnI family protein [Mycobacteroides chelonae]